MKPSILVITPVRHINGVADTLEACGDVTYLDDPSPEDVTRRIGDHDALYTNPNKSNVFISRDLIGAGAILKVVCTASTGTNHIDLAAAKDAGVAVLSLTEERDVINRITSTAEHAFGLMMAALRRVAPGWESVKRGEWDYLPYVGRQLNALTVGVVGYGRLGSLFAGYCQAFGSRVLVHDPYKLVDDPALRQVELEELLAESDVISLHVHVTPETLRMVGGGWLASVKPDLVLVNTSRGDVCDEAALVEFLEANPRALYATDVLANETTEKFTSRLRAWAIERDQVLITPHIGGMTVEAQEIAYNHAARMLKDFLGSRVAATS